MSEMSKKIKYPLGHWLTNCFSLSIGMIVIYCFLPSGVTIAVFIASVVYAIAGYLIGQYRYTEIEVSDDGIKVVFLASLYLNDRTYLYKDITQFFFSSMLDS